LNLILAVQVGLILIGGVVILIQKVGGGNQAGAQTSGEDASQPAGNASGNVERKIPVKWTHEPLGDLSAPEIRVQKSLGILTILDLDEPVKSYRVAVGPNPGPKQVEGDLRTPEGEYYVCLRQGRGQTRFVRALGLNYPNAADARRGLSAGRITQAQFDKIVYEVDRGRQPPWDTPLGGEILIHGKKDGRSETKGCIALEDAQILEIFPKIPLNTLVVILP
jgi:murein L,D-transpeptidase YafK